MQKDKMQYLEETLITAITHLLGRLGIKREIFFSGTALARNKDSLVPSVVQQVTLRGPFWGSSYLISKIIGTFEGYNIGSVVVID